MHGGRLRAAFVSFQFTDSNLNRKKRMQMAERDFFAFISGLQVLLGSDHA